MLYVYYVLSLILQYECKKPCAKLNKNCSQDHKCNKKCYEECLFCSLKVDKILECKHLKKSVNCGDDIKKLQCSKHLPCNRILECGHKCQRKCYEKCRTCKFIVRYNYTFFFFYVEMKFVLLNCFFFFIDHQSTSRMWTYSQNTM